MGGKKKKKKGKSSKKKKEDDGEKEEKEEFVVQMPSYGWIRLQLKLCDPPFTNTNTFRTVMRSNQSMMDVKKRIIDYHGRIENIVLYNIDPYPARRKENDFKREAKPRVPPFSALDKLISLKKEKEDIDEKEAIRAKKIAEGQNVPDEEPNKYGLDAPDPNRFEVLKYYDFPEDLKGESIVCYEHDKYTLYDIFQDYGTEAKPKEDPRYDPEPPKPKEKVLQPSKPVVKEEPKEKDEEEKEEGEGDGPESPTKIEEEEPEEVFIPPVEKILWYDFDTYDGKEPVLLALMKRGENDDFTL